MQIGGIGSDHSHSEHTHYVATGLHDHSSFAKDDVAGKMSSSGAKAASAPAARQNRFSLAEWLADPFKEMKKVLSRFWNGGTQNGREVNGSGDRAQSGAEQILANIAEDMDEDLAGSIMGGTAGGQSKQQAAPNAGANINVLHTPQIAAASTAIQPQNVQNNPYFSAIEDTGRQHQTLWQKVRVRFQSVTGFLTKRFSFAGTNSFQTKQERPKEDLRKRSRYHGKDLDIDCVLTDDSYLLDSYDKSGQYSQLSTNVRKS